MDIHIVMGSQGEYSDRSEWIVGAYTDPLRAANRVLALEQLQPRDSRSYWAVSYWVSAPIPLDMDL